MNTTARLCIYLYSRTDTHRRIRFANRRSLVERRVYRERDIICIYVYTYTSSAPSEICRYIYISIARQKKERERERKRVIAAHCKWLRVVVAGYREATAIVAITAEPSVRSVQLDTSLCIPLRSSSRRRGGGPFPFCTSAISRAARVLPPRCTASRSSEQSSL